MGKKCYMIPLVVVTISGKIQANGLEGGYKFWWMIMGEQKVGYYSTQRGGG